VRNKPVFVVTGPSGAGKSMLEKALIERMPDRVELAVSATTRERRPGERNGVHYWFVSDDDFDRMVADDELLEWVSYVSGHRYGTPRSEIDRIRAAGKAPLLDLETEGALRVRDGVPGAVTIFVDAPSFAELERRLRERATESAGEIGERLALAQRQRDQAGEFDHVVVNDDLERAADELAGLVNDSLAAAGTISRP
jgi:guanylate kinase